MKMGEKQTNRPIEYRNIADIYTTSLHTLIELTLFAARRYVR